MVTMGSPVAIRLVFLGSVCLLAACTPTGSLPDAGRSDAGVVDPPNCDDGEKNGTELGPDCGGSCEACPNGEACVEAAGCRSGICQAGTCVAPSCADGQKNGDELAVDCGGSCGPCGDGLACTLATGCTSGVCSMGVCAAAPAPTG